MASDPHIELRLSRLENDTTSIYDLITEIRSTQHEHSRRLDTVDHRLDAVDHHLDAVDRRLEAVERRFDTVDHRLGTVDARFDTVDHRFDSVDATLAEIVRRLPAPS